MGPVKFKVIEIPGTCPATSRLVESTVEFDAAIVMFDVMDRGSLSDVNLWINEVIQNREYDIPIIVCGNKYDFDKKVKNSHIIKSPFFNKYIYCDISIRHNHSFQGINPFWIY